MTPPHHHGSFDQPLRAQLEAFVDLHRGSSQHSLDGREACEASRRAVAGLGPDDTLDGNRRGPLPLRWVFLHVVGEPAQHAGHADILREQVLAADAPG